MAAQSVKAKGGREEYSHTVDDFLSMAGGGRPNAVIKLHQGLYARREYDTVFVSRTKPRSLLRKVEVRLKAPGRTKWNGFEFRTSIMNKRPKDFSSDKRFPPDPRRFGVPTRRVGRVPRKGGQGRLTTAYFDFKSLSAPLKIRTFRHGDRIMPLGMKGRKKLKDIFVDEKVSAGKRLKTPVITAGGEVAWVVGLRQSELFKVTEETGKTLKIEVSGSSLR